MTLREYIAYLGYDTEQFFADIETFYVWTDDDFTYPTEDLEFYLDNEIHTIINRVYLDKDDPLEKRIDTFEVSVYAK
jgi:hypothetical protein